MSLCVANVYAENFVASFADDLARSDLTRLVPCTILNKHVVKKYFAYVLRSIAILSYLVVHASRTITLLSFANIVYLPFAWLRRHMPLKWEENGFWGSGPLRS